MVPPESFVTGPGRRYQAVRAGSSAAAVAAPGAEMGSAGFQAICWS
jgi:hypothetical protein